MNAANLADITLGPEDATLLAAIESKRGEPRERAFARGIEALARQEEALDVLLREGEASINLGQAISHKQFTDNLRARFPDLAGS